MDWKYKTGDHLFFNCTDSSWVGHENVRCEVIRRLTEDEADLCETGPMYRLKILDLVILGCGACTSGIVHEAAAFEDELSFRPISK